SMPQFVWKCRPDGACVYFNQRWVDYTGLSLEESFGSGWIIPFHPDDRQRAAAAWKNAVENGATYDPECRLRDRHGNYRWFLIRGVPQRDEAGAIVWWFGTCTDIDDQKRTAEELREKDALIRIAGRITRTGGWVLEVPSERLFWSDEVFDILEFPPGSVPPVAKALALYTDRWRDQTIAALNACIREGTAFDLEVEILTAQGRQTWVRVCGEAERRPDGSISRVRGAFQDISERKQAEVETRLNAQRYRTLVEATTAIVWDTPPSGELETEQPSWAAFTGQSFEEYRGWGWLNAIHPDDQAETGRVWTAAVESRGIYAVEHRLRFHDQTYHDMLVRGVAIVGEDGAILQWIGIHTDITERKQKEEELRRTQAFLNLVVENLPIGVFIKEARELRVVLWNKAIRELFGWPAEDLIGKNEYDLLPKADADSITAKDREVLSGSGLVDIAEEVIHTRHRGERIFHTKKLPVLDDKGRAAYLLGITEDITERKQVEIELEVTHRKLLDASRQAGMAEVATSVLHNVGNVLNSVNVASNCMADRLRKSKASNLSKVVAMLREHEEDLGTYLKTDPKGKQIPGYLIQLADYLVEEQSNTLKELAQLQKNIEHIKDIVMMQQSGAKLTGLTEAINASQMMEDALKMNVSSVANHDIQVSKVFDDVPSFISEKHKVLQILVNLIRNASQACDESGHGEKRLTLRVYQAEDRVCLSVSDNGIGIPPENLIRIFTHGFTTKKDGHGFGLHNAALTAKQLGGELVVHSDGPGKGSNFTLELPLADPVTQ
ncbi:MAG: PAS domain S-box protein, partial [Verrucomicrobiota bacterium]